MSARREPDEQGTAELFDAVVIGTGFGGAVAACRLAQAGKRICILERGRRYGPHDFPRPAKRPDHLPHTARWAWALDHGLWDVRDLQGTLAVQAAGYGGGSLVYANVHLRPPPEVFAPPTAHGLATNGWPATYTRKELDPYYDVVAAVLGVQPFPRTPPPSSHLTGPLPKLQAMQAAATGLERAGWFFRPPLAIDFGRCVMCGECVAGCTFGAKNTLDLNYLAAAEREGDVDVRTLAEAHDIRQDADGYTVRYRDHVTGEDGREVRARSVFLCAGAVSSTHILLRSRELLPIADGSRPHIGRRFFANGDAIAMIYDTTSAPTPTLGPTITTALLYNKSHPAGVRGDWFLLQEGGYPKWLEPVLGLFRGRFWLERNRIERAGGRVAPTDPDADTREAAAFMREAQALGRALLGLLDARGAFREAPTLRDLSAGRGLDRILPRQVREQLVPHARAFAHRIEREETDAVTHETLAEITKRILEDHPWWEIFVNLAKDRVEPYLVPATLEILHRHFLKAPENAPEPFSFAVLWPLLMKAAQKLFLGARPDDHAFLMLALGVDAAPGLLKLDDDGRLLADWNLAANQPFATTEERLMHDVADELRGELRLNPDTTARQRPVTVHGLGGCAMSDVPADGVTDPNGKVWGTRALYVLDGAAMPGPLGTNPSATIAAVAERNVRKALEDPASPIFTPAPVPLDPPLPRGPSLADIRAGLGQTRAVLDPIAGIPPTPREPRAPALGLGFEEVMRGFYTAPDRALRPIRARLTATIADLNAFLVDPLRTVAVTGTVWLTPVAGGGERPYTATGALELLKRVEAGAALRSLFAEGVDTVDALVRVRARPAVMRADRDARHRAEAAMESLLARLERQAHRYEMEYDLTLTPETGDGASFALHGVKTISGGPGLAAWTQTTTVAIVLTQAGAEVGTGTMHVHLADFLQTQLPSFRVSGTADDVRIAWALGRFFRFFLGTLRQVYLPRLESLDPFGDRGP